MQTFKPMHPGEFVKISFIEDTELTTTELANHLNVSSSSLSRLLNEKSDLSYDMAVALEKFSEISAETWMNIQVRYGIHRAKMSKAEV